MIELEFPLKAYFFLNGHSFSCLLIVVNRSSLQAFHGASQMEDHNISAMDGLGTNYYTPLQVDKSNITWKLFRPIIIHKSK